jgi:hypothetical protein
MALFGGRRGRSRGLRSCGRRRLGTFAASAGKKNLGRGQSNEKAEMTVSIHGKAKIAQLKIAQLKIAQLKIAQLKLRP